MTSDLATAQAAQRRRAALVGAAFVAGFHLLELGSARATELLLARVAWIAVLVGFGLAPATSPSRERARVASVAFASGLALCAILHLDEGIRSIYFGYLFAIPLAILVLAPGETAGAVSASVATLGGGIALLVAAGAPARTVVSYAGAMVGTSLLAVIASRGYHALREAEREAEEARNAAQASLAESERRRARAERLALVGELAAGVAHELNNPLSFVTSNVRWVRDALVEDAAGAEGRDELVSVLREAELGLARMAGIVAEMRSLALVGPEGAERDERPSGAGAPPAVSRTGTA
jgi:signal transduction histidine kinase